MNKVTGGTALVGSIQASGTIRAAGDPGFLQLAEIALTNAEIKALRGAPKLLVAAPGAGKLILPVAYLALLDAGTNVLTESAANLEFRYVGVAAPVLETIESTGFVDSAADTARAGGFLTATELALTKALSENKGVELFNNGAGEIAGNAALDATLRVKLWYLVISTGW